MLCFTGCGKSSIVSENNSAFTKAVEAITTDEVALNDITAFDWDTVYTFSPYTSKESIEEIIGFKSNNIEETVSEGMTQLLFVKGEEVVCSICGYDSNLGYKFSFGAYNGNYIAVSNDDNASFAVNASDGIVYLTYHK
ncbi:MAG: hypothetical protein LBB48_04690 [Treponema sp.]|jgi:hypothetical protein|nr:hypothetical protein [Treponema sp.]